MQKWRDEDSAPYVEFVEELASMDVPELPDGLEEAAEKHIQSVVDAAGHPGWDWEARDVRDAFIAGAEWQKDKMLEGAVEFECIGKKVKMTIQELINYYIDQECCDVADECGF